MIGLALLALLALLWALAHNGMMAAQAVRQIRRGPRPASSVHIRMLCWSAVNCAAVLLAMWVAVGWAS